MCVSRAPTNLKPKTRLTLIRALYFQKAIRVVHVGNSTFRILFKNVRGFRSTLLTVNDVSTGVTKRIRRLRAGCVTGPFCWLYGNSFANETLRA